MRLLHEPHPSELQKLLDPDSHIEQHRNLFCGHYETCLDEAVNNRWISWTCGCCALFAVRPTNVDEAENRGGVMALRHRGSANRAVAIAVS